MPVVFLYLFKLSVSLSVVYIFYRFVLQRLTFYHCSRFYLLVYTALSFLIPFVNITPALEKSNMIDNGAVKFIPSVNAMSGVTGPLPGNTAESFFLSAWDWLLLVIVTGMIVMLARLLLQLLSLSKMIKKARLVQDKGIKLYQVDGPVIPFSFGNSIFLNRKQHPESDLKEIIHHEFVHIKHMHTIDIIWSELLCMLNWYNPLVWLIRRAIRQNLEFIADNNLLQSGIDKKQYQYLLLKVVGNNHFSIATQFNFSSLKKRIAMMNKMKSARVHLLKFIFVLPVLLVLILSFRDGQDKNSGREGEQAINLSAGPHITGDTVPVKASPSTTNETGFLKRHPDVKGLNWAQIQSLSATVPDPNNDRDIAKTGDVLLQLILKNGNEENYFIAKKTERDRFKKTYGELPPEPPATTSLVLEPAQPGHPVDLDEGDPGEAPSSPVALVTAVQGHPDKPQATGISKDAVAVDPAIPELPAIPKKAVSPVTKTTGNVPKADATAASPASANQSRSADASAGKSRVYTTVSSSSVDAARAEDTRHERPIVAVFEEYMTEADVKKIENDLKRTGYDFRISDIGHNNGKLIRVEGSISKNSKKQYFSVTDFSRLIISDEPENKNDGRFNFVVISGRMSVSDKPLPQ